jgi:transcriptional regulator with XRE-family HTH domain
VLTESHGRRVGAVTAAVARHVRALRAARGWSLDELAGRSGVSKGMVVQIEGGRTNPSIGTLCRIADAFEVSVARLLEATDRQDVRVVDLATAPVLWRGTSGGLGRLLAGTPGPQYVELWDWVISPGERHVAEEHAGGTYEMLHVQAGTAVVSVDGADFPVDAGQTIRFPADRPHAYRNDGDERVHLVMVVVMPGEPDRP